MHRKAGFALALFAALVIASFAVSHSSFAAKISASRQYPPTPAAWTGHNRNLGKYQLAPGYPAYVSASKISGRAEGLLE